MIKSNLFLILFALMASSFYECGGDKTASSPDKGLDETKVEEKRSPTDEVSTNRKGKLIYKQYCVICHGADGTLAISGATDLSTSLGSIEERISQITNGMGLMTPYKDILSESQIIAVAEYLTELRQ